MKRKESIGFLFLQRIFTTLACILIVLVVILEVALAIIAYIPFYFLTGLEAPMFYMVDWTGEKLRKLKYVQDI